MPTLIENTAAALTVAGGAFGGVELLETVEVFNGMTHIQEGLKNMGFWDVSLVIAGLFILNRGTAALLSKQARPSAKIIGTGLFAVGAGATFLAPAVMETINKGVTAGGLEIAPFIALGTISFAGIQWLLQTIHSSNFSGEYSCGSETPEELAAQAIENWQEENDRMKARTESKIESQAKKPISLTKTRIVKSDPADDIINRFWQRIEKRDQDTKNLSG